MQRIAAILLRTYLRRNPIPVRLSQFNWLSRYSWLQNLLEELRPELFPEPERGAKPLGEERLPDRREEPSQWLDAEALRESAGLEPAGLEPFGPARWDQALVGQTLKGLQGTYRIEAILRPWVTPMATGAEGEIGAGEQSNWVTQSYRTVLRGTWVEAQRPVAITLYHLYVAADPDELGGGVWTNVTQTRGTQTRGIQTSGIQTSGIQTSGIQTSGIQTSGLSTHSAHQHRLARQRQRQFSDQACLTLADGRSEGRVQDFRVLRPLEAIAAEPVSGETWTDYPCYLVSDAIAIAPTLRQHLSHLAASHLSGLEPNPTPSPTPNPTPSPLLSLGLSLGLSQDIVAQLLQSLDFLHSQTFVLNGGQTQRGIVHGNLSLDTVRWSEPQPGIPYVYLSDLSLWEGLFPLGATSGVTPGVTPGGIQRDLAAVAMMGWVLLGDGAAAVSMAAGPATSGAATSGPATSGPAMTGTNLALFHGFLRRLAGAGFDSAAAAHQALMQLRAAPTPASLGLGEPQTPPPRPRALPILPLALALGGVAALGGVGWWWLQRVPVAQGARLPVVCCLRDVQAVPSGEFTYTALEKGAWRTLLQQGNLRKRGQRFQDVLSLAQPQLRLRYRPTMELEEAIAWVRQGRVDFAIVPLLGPLQDRLPLDLVSEPIAYDGLAVVVNFSYAQRRASLPQALGGRISLDQVRRIYTDPTLQSWRSLTGTGMPYWSRSSLPLRRYLPDQPEALLAIEQLILRGGSWREAIADRPTWVEPDEARSPTPVLPMLRQVIRDFEQGARAEGGGETGAGTTPIGAIALSPLSQIRGQCSVYPLAIQSDSQPAVQPWWLGGPVLPPNREAHPPNTVPGQRPIQPSDDLCDRKGDYAPAIALFQQGRYPLAYAIAVLYPADNRRAAIGQKIVALLKTSEAQQLLGEAGLVPLESP